MRNFVPIHRNLPMSLCIILRHLSLASLALLGTRGLADAQSPSPVQVKGAYVLNFLKYVEWKDEGSVSRFVVGMYGEDEALYRELSTALPKMKAKQKGIQVVQVSDIEQAKSVHLLMVAGSENTDIRAIANGVRRTNTLLVTDNCGDKQSIMINLTAFGGDRIGFEVNKPNIVYEGLKLSPDILFLGGTELDVAELYREMEASLQNTRETVGVQQAELERQRDEIEERGREIETQNARLAKQNREIEEKQALLGSLEKRLADERSVLRANQSRMEAYESELRSKLNTLAAREIQVETLAAEINANREVLEKQRGQISAQAEQIEQQQENLETQDSTIQRQEALLLGGGIILLLVITLGGVISWGYRLNRKTSAALRQSEADFRSLVLNTPGVVYRCALDEHWTMMYMSDRIEDLSGYPSSDFIGNEARSFASIIAPEDVEMVDRVVQEGVERRQPYIIEYRIQHRDGSLRWVYEQGSAVFEEKGDVSYLDGFIMDITERKEKDRFLRFATHAMDNSADIALWLDADTAQLRFVNKAACEQLGYTKEELLELTIPDIDPLFPQERWPAFSSSLREQGFMQFETQQQRKNGEIYPAEVTVSSVDFERVTYFISFSRDITDRKKADAELLAAKEAADEANSAKSMFLANMSHEIRTPMNAVLGFSEVLRTLVKGEQEKQYLDSIQSSGKALLGLINDILDLSKVEAGKLELEYAAVDAPAVFQDMEAVFGQRMDEKGLTFILDLDPDLRKALILDEVRLRQVLINLIGNAIKFTEEGHVRLAAAAVSERETGSRMDLMISVEDTGIGIPEDQQGKIFGAFEQTVGQSHIRFGGTGLGLAITKRLVELMGGEISVESQVGKGSTFHIRLKHVAVASVDDLAETDTGIDPDALQFDPASVLVVDDVEANRQLVSAFLSPYGLAVMEAADGEEGVEQTRAHRPNLVLMDIRMSGMDGLTATRVLKEDGETADIPIVALTASVMKEDEDEIRESFDGFLRKPVNRAALMAELARFLPHETAASISPEPAASPAAEVWQPEDLDGESLAKLSALVDVLESDVRPVWEGVRGTANVSAVEEFAELLGRVVDGTLFPPLQSWTEKLKGQAGTFQMDLLPQTLEEFPDLVENLKQVTTHTTAKEKHEG